MRYYTIQNGSLLIAENKQALLRFYDNVKELPSDYEDNKYVVKDGELVLNPDFESQKEQEEKERIAKLFLTGADVERGIYQAKGMDFEDIIELVTQLQPEGLDIKALKIELKANNFYRGNPYVVAIGQLLGFTEEQLNLFFKDGNYEHLLPKEEPTETPVDPQEGQDTSELESTDDPSLTQGE